MTKLKEVVDSITTRLERVETENRDLRTEIKHLNKKIHVLEATVMAHEPDKDTEPDPRTVLTAFACLDATVTLTCPSGRTIMTSYANYGQHYHTCSGCCAPNPGYDCTELVEENRPTDWAGIQLLCDNQTSCEFQNLGSVINECESGYTSDYMQVFYDCLPHDETGPVAFMAWADTGSETNYRSGDVVVFNAVLNNIGGHYNTDTSSFICPWDGVYVFSVSVMGYVNDDSHIDLMHNNNFMTRIWIDGISGAYNRGSMTTAIECERGDVIWNRAGSHCSIHTTGDVRTTFSGFLLHRY